MGTFIGRRHEVAQVRRSLEGSRLVTLVGAGGVGKTRLAVRVAGQLRAYDDGAWLVELAAVTDPDAVASTVADVLGVADRSSRSVLSALASYVEDKQLLLVLDNCEHQVDACARLVGKLLAVAPRLCVLATSRQPLAVEGEHLIAVPPLSYPDPELLPPGNLSEFEAVRLFMERAKAVVPDFDLTPATRTAVAAVCRRVDGLPLAIELAAARLRVLSVTQLLDRLDDRLDVLRSRSPVAPTRQQTLRATLDWSYDMCSPAEQILWARLSVFADGFDLEAAEYVCSGLGLDAGTLFEVMAALIDKSILLRLDGVGNAARYGMLHTLRGYGRERLAAAGEQAARRDRHRAYYWELARWDPLESTCRHASLSIL